MRPERGRRYELPHLQLPDLPYVAEMIEVKCPASPGSALRCVVSRHLSSFASVQ
jgi:hypothetical protein